jgi:serine/threonine-protein kinase
MEKDPLSSGPASGALPGSPSAPNGHERPANGSEVHPAGVPPALPPSSFWSGEAAPAAEPRRSPQGLLATEITALAGRPVPGAGAPKSAEQKPPEVLGDFRLVHMLGEGAMGSVYRAEQISTPCEVALKIMFPHLAKNSRFVERFYREALIMGRLDHPNIVRGYAVGEEQGWHYFAMEYIGGRSLQKWLSVLGRLSVGDAVHIVLTCADALRYAHEHDVVHRDIKPDNILITHQGAIKLTDFGAVKVLTEDLAMTQTGHGIGTPCYMPLEQARNAKDSDGRSDIYALGCVLYCLLTGQPPFAGETLVDLIQAKTAAKFPPARRANPLVPERLDLIIDKMVAKVIQYRYQTCAEIIRDLNTLRVANSTLSFIPTKSGSEDVTPPMLGPAESTPLPSATKPVRQAPRADDSYSGWWYVKTSGGTRKLKESQVLRMIDKAELGPNDMASRTATGGFRALSCYREFERSLFSRPATPEVDVPTTKMRDLYKQFDEEGLERERENLLHAIIPDWTLFLYKLAIIGVTGGLIYFVLQWLVRWLINAPASAA